MRMLCLVALTASVAVCAPAMAQDAKTQPLQEFLEKQPFGFSQSEASVLFSLTQFAAECQVHMIYDPAKQWQLKFKFVKAGKEVLSLDGHSQSVFRADCTF